jgi:hypothetical protein
MKVAAGSQRHRPHLFIGGETQRSKFLNLTVKRSASRAFGVIQARPSGTDAWEDIFFRLDSRSPRFRWLRLAPRQALRHRGASVGGIRNQSFRIPKIKECFQLPEFLCEKPSGETPGVLESIFISQNPSFDQYPSSPAEPPKKLIITRGVRVSVRLFGFPTTKPQRRILLTQLVLAWDSLGGFRRP